MKNHYRYFVLTWAFILYILVCAIDIVIYKLKIIPHCGLQEYSLPERVFMSFLFFVPMILNALALKRDNVRSFAIGLGIFWLSSFILCHLVNIPCLVSLYIKGYETFDSEVNWLRQDIWWNSYCGAFVGTIVAGIVSAFRQRKKKCQQNIKQ